MLCSDWNLAASVGFTISEQPEPRSVGVAVATQRAFSFISFPFATIRRSMVSSAEAVEFIVSRTVTRGLPERKERLNSPVHSLKNDW